MSVQQSSSSNISAILRGPTGKQIFITLLFYQLVKGRDIAKILDMKGREKFVELVNVSNLIIINRRNLAIQTIFVVVQRGL